MTPCLSQATTMSLSFAEDVAAHGDARVGAVEVWLTKLEKHLETNSAADTKALVEGRGLKLVAASYQGGVLVSQGEARKLHFEHFRRRLEICQEFGIGVMNLIADFAGTPDEETLGRAVVSLKQAGQWAAGFGVELALEFRANSGFCTSLDTAIDLVAQVAEANVGVCLDLFHFMKGPSKTEDILRLHPGMLKWVQICDVAGVPREAMTDADRIMPGEGDFPIWKVVENLTVIGYEGYVSLELMNPVLWKMKGSQVAELGYQAIAVVLAER